jgi:predicted nuclease with TOPRIM domain
MGGLKIMEKEDIIIKLIEEQNKKFDNIEKENKEIKDELTEIKNNHLNHINKELSRLDKHIDKELSGIDKNNAVINKSLEWNNRLTIGIFLAIIATAIKYFFFP